MGNNYKPKLAVLSFYNCDDGISEYTEHLFSPIADEIDLFFFANKDHSSLISKDSDNVYRNWKIGEGSFAEVLQSAQRLQIEFLHIQYHQAYKFDFEALEILIDALNRKGIKSFLTFHAVRGRDFDMARFSNSLSKFTNIFVHNKSDFDYLSRSLKNVVYFSLPRIHFERRDKVQLKKLLGLDEYYPIICSHGLLNTNKNIPNVVKAVANLKLKYPKILFVGLNAVVDSNIYAQSELQIVTESIDKLGLKDNSLIITDFLSFDQVSVIMQACDVNVLAYSESGESASAAVSKAFASGNPTIVSKVKAFDEFEEEVVKSETDVDSLAGSIDRVIQEHTLSKSLTQSAKGYIEKYSFENMARVVRGYYIKSK